jgi:alanine racemase
MSSHHTAWVAVDTGAIRDNYRLIKEHVGADVSVMAVVKTNAYGHGIALVAKALEHEADMFGVSTPEEGAAIREAGVATPVLVFHPAAPWNAEMLVANDLVATVESAESADALAAAGAAAGRIPRAHIKVDTGMSRFGLSSKSLMKTIAARQDIRVEGLYSHLATAATDDEAGCRSQMKRFAGALEAWAEDLPRPPFVHLLNSAGLLRFAEARYTMVRAGTLLFGQYPSPSLPKPLDLKPTWAFRTRIVAVRNIKAGASVGYGAEWTAKRPSRIATIPVGYADGFTVQPLSVWQRQGGLKGLAKRISGGNGPSVTTPYGEAPVVGRVAAQSAMLDVTDLPGIQVGDIVDVPCRRVMVGSHIARVPAG